MDGQATQYDIRCALDLSLSADWDAATVVDSARVPKPAGQAETLVVAGLSDGTWQFALKAADEVPNWSALSNVASATLRDTVPPASVTDLVVVFGTMASVKLSWTASGDNGRDGMASEYDLRCSPEPITEENWDEARRVEGLPTPSAAGSAESTLVTGLETGATYAFALKTIDAALNESLLSNIASGTTASLFRLTFSVSPSGAFSPQWSPDGRNIAFVTDWDGGPGHLVDLFMISADGGEPVRLTDDPDLADSPSWSPDGAQLALISTRTYFPEIYIMNAIAGADPVQVTAFQGAKYPHEVRWSPDGNQLAYLHKSLSDIRDDIYIMPSTGGTSALVFEGLRMRGLAWSPDGSRIAFAAYEGISPNGNWEIASVPVSGGPAVRLTRDPAKDDWPAWSPDGTQVAFVSNRNGSDDLWMMSADGGDLIQVTVGPAKDSTPCWSPDGGRIAFSSQQDGIYDVWILDLHKGTKRGLQ